MLLRLESITSWIEAQESLAMWLASKGNRAFWRALDDSARERAFQAGWLAELPSHVIRSEGHGGRTFIGAAVWEGLGLGYDHSSGRKWSRRDWANILYRAWWLAKRGDKNCTPLEEWVWWCYPVFRRYEWSAREVLECCCRRFREDPTGLLNKHGAHFGRYWMTRGLRFSGGKTSRKNPPLAELLITLRVPDLDAAHGIVIF